jgi:hypothetical protein
MQILDFVAKCKPKVHSIVPNKEEDMGVLG